MITSYASPLFSPCDEKTVLAVLHEIQAEMACINAHLERILKISESETH